MSVLGAILLLFLYRIIRGSTAKAWRKRIGAFAFRTAGIPAGSLSLPLYRWRPVGVFAFRCKCFAAASPTMSTHPHNLLPTNSTRYNHLAPQSKIHTQEKSIPCDPT
jgi:hypothetical protein